MIIPVRCFTCNYPISCKWARYNKMVSSGIHPSNVFVDLNVKRYCCKRMLMSNEDIIDRVMKQEQKFDYIYEY